MTGRITPESTSVRISRSWSPLAFINRNAPHDRHRPERPGHAFAASGLAKPWDEVNWSRTGCPSPVKPRNRPQCCGRVGPVYLDTAQDDVRPGRRARRRHRSGRRRVPGPSRRPTFSNFVMPTPNTDDANLVDLPVSALLFAPRRHPGQVIGAVPGDRRARRVQGSELGGGQGDRQRAKVLLDA